MAVGRLRPPFVDDVAHYTKLLQGHARIELVEVRDGERAERRVPDGAYVSLLAADGEQLDSPGFARFIAQRRMSQLSRSSPRGPPTTKQRSWPDRRRSSIHSLKWTESNVLPSGLSRTV